MSNEKTGDAKIKAATQEILEVVRKYDLNIFFCLVGRNLVETRHRFATWSCMEQTSAPGGSSVHFRTRKGGDGERRPEKDIGDSLTVARSFAEMIGRSAIPAIGMWEELKAKLGAESTYDEDRGGVPPWDLK